MTHFEESYKTLNKAQKEAVDTIDGPVLVVAGPGTGKTQLLSTRVANILDKTDSEPQNILCLTFTNKAATNMRERLTQLIGPSSRGVVVRTFHSFAAEIMNQYPDYFWNGARLSVAPDAVQDDIIQTILAHLPLDNPLATTFAGNYTALGDVKTALKLAKEAGLTPDQLSKIIKHNIAYIDKVEGKLSKLLTPPLSIKRLPDLRASIKTLPVQKLPDDSLLLPLSSVILDSLEFSIEQDVALGKTTQTGKWKQRWVQVVDGKKAMFDERKRNDWWLAVADVYQDYRKQLHQRGYYDYSDMLIEVLEQLERQPDMLADIQERFLYVLIDEFQDTNAAQLRLAHLVSDHYAANGRPNLMAVGDDDQSIFAFNGAELNNMLSFQRSYPDTKVVVLRDNYRSAQPILDLNKQIIDQAEDRLTKRNTRLSKELIAQNPPKGKVDIRHMRYPTREHQFAAVAGQIKELWEAGHQDIAVLARKHDSLRQLASILLHSNIPIRYDQQSNILEHEAVSQACLIAQAVVAITIGDRANTNLHIATLIRHPMWDISAKTLWKLAVANYSSPDWLDSLLSSDDQKLQNIGNWLVWLSRSSDKQPLPLTMEYILGLSEGQYLLSPFRKYYLNLKPTTTSYIETLSSVQILRGLTQEFASKQATLADFVRFIELNTSTGRVIANESWFVTGIRAVQLLTVHKAKGLEFDQVFVVDSIESMWSPRSGGRISPANLQLQSYGEKYDDYIRLLYVAASRAKRAFIASSYVVDERGGAILATPLLSALPLVAIGSPKERPKEILEESVRWPALNTDNETVILGNILENFSLSASALLDFLNVAEAGPISFKERQLLHLPRPRSASGSYGVAIHAALETAQRLVNTNTLAIEPVLDRFEASLGDEHLGPQDYDRFRIRGQKLLPKLIKHASTLLPKGGLSEQKISDIFLGPVRLFGKLDRIDQTPARLTISDYKTGKPLPRLETQDQTKAVKAWRHKTQLLFYTLLVQQSARFNTPSISTQMLYVEAEREKDLVLQFTPSPQELERLEKIILHAWQHIMKLSFPDTSHYSKDLKGIKQFEEDLLSGTI